MIAEDIVQDVYLKFWKKHENLKPDLAAKPYLYVAVKNTSLNHIKSAKRNSNVEDEQANVIFVNNETAIDKMEFEELEQKILDAINELPPKCREVFRLSRYEELSYKEIAESLDISVKTVENQMGKALKRLRESLHTYIKMAVLLIIFNVF